MAPTLDATLSGTKSNSYITLEQALFLARNIPGGEAWIATPEDDRNLSLITATAWLETLNYVGDRCNASQALKWPRSGGVCDGVTSDCNGIPLKIQKAEVVLAIKYVESPASFPGAGGGDSAPSGTYVKRQKIGGLEIEYDQFNTNFGSSCDDCDNPQIIQSFPWIDDLLGCWIQGGALGSGGSGLILRVRS